MFNPDIPCVTRADWTSVIYSPGSQNTHMTDFIMILEWNCSYADKSSPTEPGNGDGLLDVLQKNESKCSLIQNTNKQIKQMECCFKKTKLYCEQYISVTPSISSSRAPALTLVFHLVEAARQWLAAAATVFLTGAFRFNGSKSAVRVLRCALINTYLAPIITLLQPHQPQNTHWQPERWPYEFARCFTRAP